MDKAVSENGKCPRNEGSLKLKMLKESIKLKAGISGSAICVRAEKRFVRGLGCGM